jgi:hypothetical protein
VNRPAVNNCKIDQVAIVNVQHTPPAPTAPAADTSRTIEPTAPAAGVVNATRADAPTPEGDEMKIVDILKRSMDHVAAV